MCSRLGAGVSWRQNRQRQLRETEHPANPSNSTISNQPISASFMLTEFGEVLPREAILLSFYSERLPIPQKLVHEVTAEGRLGKETSRKTKEGLIREVDVEVLMDLDMSKSFRA